MGHIRDNVGTSRSAHGIIFDARTGLLTHCIYSSLFNSLLNGALRYNEA